MNIRFLEVASVELDEAIEYYDRELPGLGKTFLAEVLAALDRIRRFPQGWHSLGKGVRRCRLRRFPYGLVYHVAEEGILILAVAHTHRRPDYWRDRLGPEREDDGQS